MECAQTDLGLHPYRREAKSAGRGVLSAAGLSADQGTGDGRRKSGDRKPASTDPQPKGKRKTKQKTLPDSRLWDWIERYKKQRDAKRKGPHTPGVWVIYFALAALPLFALGQSLIDVDDEARRRASFLQMAVYIASALGLLVTTSLLGLRRYLRSARPRSRPPSPADGSGSARY